VNVHLLKGGGKGKKKSFRDAPPCAFGSTTWLMSDFRSSELPSQTKSIRKGEEKSSGQTETQILQPWTKGRGKGVKGKGKKKKKKGEECPLRAMLI